jgi:hypothetical protein
MKLSDIEMELRDYVPSGKDRVCRVLPKTMVWPRYEGRSIGNIAQTVAQALGCSLQNTLPPLDPDLVGDSLDGVRRVIVLIMDALGWLQLRRVMAVDRDLVFHRLAAQGQLVPITTTFLSTTNSVLSSIWTGRSPSEHGLLAFEMYMREWLMAIEAISFSSPYAKFEGLLESWGFDPLSFLPVPSIGQSLSSRGVTSRAVIHKRFTTTPLSRMHFRGISEVRGHSYASDFWVELHQVLKHHLDERLLLAGYWPAVDTLAHRFGPEDPRGVAEIRAIGLLMETLFLDALTAEERDGTLLLLTADHGQIGTRPEDGILMEDHPELSSLLRHRPVGESRVPFFHVRTGKLEEAWSYLNGELGSAFVFMMREQLIESGLLGPGPVYNEVYHRVGDIVGISKGDAFFAVDGEDANRLEGRHGGLTPEEMLVPLLAVRLDR